MLRDLSPRQDCHLPIRVAEHLPIRVGQGAGKARHQPAGACAYEEAWPACSHIQDSLLEAVGGSNPHQDTSQLRQLKLPHSGCIRKDRHAGTRSKKPATIAERSIGHEA